MDDRRHRIVCAWCRAVIFEPFPGLGCPDVVDGRPVLVSHCICPDCYAEQEAVLDGMAPPPAHAGVTGGEG